MRVGFTGTRDGMANAQRESVRIFFLGRTVASVCLAERTWLHHGDCVGADAQAHAIALTLRWGVIIHPANVPGARAFCKGAEVVHPAQPPLVRNQAIVDGAWLLIAAPKEQTGEAVRSGTWATVRYARRIGRRVVIVRPDGSVEDEPAREVETR